MEVTDELKDYSYIKICDDCFKEKKFITKYIRFFFYCTVCLSVTSLSHTSEKKKIYWNMIIKKKVWGFISFICLVIAMFLFRKKDVFKQFSAFLVLLQLHLLISWDKNLTSMFVVSISKYSLTFISWKSSDQVSFKTSEILLCLHLKISSCSKIHISVFYSS